MITGGEDNYIVKTWKDNKYFICEECSLAYNDKKQAEKCQKWCKKHHSCNMSITKYVVNK